jgi:hypothetical protein
LDFRHIQAKNAIWEMAVHVRFIKVRGNSPVVVKAQSVVLTGDSFSDVESEDLEVSEGVLIRLGLPPNLSTYIVESIDIGGRVCCKDSTDELAVPVFLSLKEAKRRYNQYIRY